MIALYIILGILLLLFLITLLNIRVHFIYNDEVKLFVRIAFVKLQLMPPKPKKEKKPKKPKKKKKKKQKEEKPEKKKSFDLKALVQEKGVSGILNIVKKVAQLASGTLKDLFSKITVTYLMLRLKIAGGDAAETAVNYGRVCAVLYPALKVISEIVKVKDYSVDVEPDFSDEPKTAAQAEVKAKIRILSILCIAVRRGIQALRLLLKARTKKKKSSQKTS